MGKFALALFIALFLSTLSVNLVFAETIIVKMKEGTAPIALSAKAMTERPLSQPSRLPISIVGFRKEMVINPFDTVHVYEVNNTVEAKEIIRRFQKDPTIEYAYIEPHYEPAVIRHPQNSEDPPLNSSQGIKNWTDLQDYLFPSPRGVDAMFAWAIPGGRGENVKIADIEWGWEPRHQDYKDNLENIYGSNNSYVEHGTAVLGEMIGVDNGIGITGIVPKAKAITVSVDSSEYPTVAEYILFAAAKLEAGDVILLEMHAGGPNKGPHQQGYVPMEYFPINFEAIKEVTLRGIIVVEAAGNGDENLDHPVYERVFDRTFQDSGAIMVGAGAPPRDNHQRQEHLGRLSFSNNGSRVDVMGYGAAVTTTGYGDLYHGLEDNFYTADFGGTSSASPIIAGVVASLQSMAKAADRLISPKEMRSLISASAQQQNFAAYPGTIGGLPDIRTAWGLYSSKEHGPIPEIIEPSQNQYITAGTEIKFVGKKEKGISCSFKVINAAVGSIISESNECSMSHKFSANGRYIVEFNMGKDGLSSRNPSVREVIVDEIPFAPELSLEYIDRNGLKEPLFSFSKPNSKGGRVFIEISRTPDFDQEKLVVNYRLYEQEIKGREFMLYEGMMEGIGEGTYYARMRIRSGLGDSEYSNVVEFDVGGLEENLKLIDNGIEMYNVVYADSDYLVSERWTFEEKVKWDQELSVYDSNSVLDSNPIIIGEFYTGSSSGDIEIVNNVLVSGGGLSPISLFAVQEEYSGIPAQPYTTMFLGYSVDRLVGHSDGFYVYSNEGKIFYISLNDPMRPKVINEYDVNPSRIVSAGSVGDRACFAVSNGIVFVDSSGINFIKISEGDVLGATVKDKRVIIAIRTGQKETMIGILDNEKVSAISKIPVLATGLGKISGRVRLKLSDGFMVLSDDLTRVVATHRTASFNTPYPFTIGDRAFLADGRLREYKFK